MLNKKIIRPLVGAILAASLITSCAPLIRPYKFDVTQGNILTQEKIDQIKIGMSEDQIQYLLGSPMLQDTFHKDRWDYVYFVKPGKGKIKKQRVTIFFEHGKVKDHHVYGFSGPVM